MRRWIWTGWFVVFVGMCCLHLPEAQAQNTTPKKTKKLKPAVLPLSILFTTDLYGRLRRFTCKRPGVKGYEYKPAKKDIANLLYLVKKWQEKINQKTGVLPLLFNTGDNLGTDLTARFLLEYEGVAGVDFIAQVFERFAFDLIGLGNHEFSVAPEKLAGFLKQANLIRGREFSIANLGKIKDANHALNLYVNRKGNQGRKMPYFVFTRSVADPNDPDNEVEFKVGVFHLVRGDLHKRVSAHNVKGVTFTDPVEKAKEIIEKLRKVDKVDYVIVLSHLETGSTKGSEAKSLIKGLAEGDSEGNPLHADLIISNDWRTDKNATSFGVFSSKGISTHVVGGRKYGEQLGRVDIKLKKVPSKNAKAKLTSTSVHAIPLDTKRYDTELRRELIKWELTYCRRWGQKLGKGTIRALEGMQKDQFYKYMLNLMRKQARTEVAFVNEAVIKDAPFPLKGYVTKDDFYRALPFNEAVEVLTLKGSELGDWLGKSKLKIEGGSSDSINGREVQSNKTYRVATISFLVLPKIEELEKAIKDAAAELKESEKRPKTLAKEIKTLKSEIKGMTGDPAKISTEANALGKRIQQLENQILAMESKPNSSFTILRAKKRQKKKLETRKEALDNALMGNLKTLIKDRNKLKAELDKMKGELKKLKAKKASLEEIQTKQNEISPKQDEYKQKSDEVAQKQGELKQKRKELKQKLAPKTIREIRKEIRDKQKALAKAKYDLKNFMSKRRVLTYSNCDKTKRDCTVRIRSMMVSHFESGDFSELTKYAKPPSGEDDGGMGMGMDDGSSKKKKEPPKPYSKTEIPFTGDFVRLDEAVAWKFDAELGLLVDSNFVNPINLGNLSYGEIPSDFFRQFKVGGTLQLNYQILTKRHEFNAIGEVNYAAYSRTQWNTDTKPPKPADIFDEENDMAKAALEYKLLLETFKPTVRGEVQTEFTPRGRTFLTNEQYVKATQQIRYRAFILRGNFGGDWTVVDSVFTLKPALTVNKQFAWDRFPQPGSPDAKKFPGLGGLPDTNLQVGGVLGFELSELQLGTENVTFGAEGKFAVRGIFLPADPKQESLLIYEGEATGTLTFKVTEALEFKLKMRFYIIRGTVQKDTSGGGDSQSNIRIPGPWATWLAPSATLNLKWGTRGQSY